MTDSAGQRTPASAPAAAPVIPASAAAAVPKDPPEAAAMVAAPAQTGVIQAGKSSGGAPSPQAAESVTSRDHHHPVPKETAPSDLPSPANQVGELNPAPLAAVQSASSRRQPGALAVNTVKTGAGCRLQVIRDCRHTEQRIYELHLSLGHLLTFISNLCSQAVPTSVVFADSTTMPLENATIPRVCDAMDGRMWHDEYLT